MTLRRRLILAVLAAVAFAWVLTSALIYLSAQEEINELYDTAMVRMAQQMQALLPRVHTQSSPAPPSGNGPIPGDADLGDEGRPGLVIWRSPHGAPTGSPCTSTRTAITCPGCPTSRGSPSARSTACPGGSTT
jgi:two-component system sensor histidine kinase QseC